MHDIPANEHTVVLITVQASVEECFAVGIDIEAYPQWVAGLTSAEVEERDDQGRPIQVRFAANAVGRRSNYVLKYDLSDAPGKLAWTMVEGDLTSRLEGAYLFEPSPDEPDATDVTYELIVDLAVPLPGFVKRRAEDKIVEAALRRFHDRVLAVSDSTFPA